MSTYGLGRKDIWIKIIHHLPEIYWKNIKCLNRDFSKLFDCKLLIKNVSLKIMCENEHIESILRCSKKRHIWEKVARYSGRFGSKLLIDLAISNGASRFDVLIGACQGGQIKLYEEIITSSNNRYLNGLDFQFAYKYKQIEFLDYLVSENTDGLYYIFDRSYINGNCDIFDYIIDIYDIQLKKVFNQLCFFGKTEKVKHLVLNGFNKLSKLRYGFFTACRGGQIDIVKFLIEKGVKAKHYDKGMIIACSTGQLEIIKLLISKGAKSFYEGLVKICQYGNSHENAKQIIELMISKGVHHLNKAL